MPPSGPLGALKTTNLHRGVIPDRLVLSKATQPQPKKYDDHHCFALVSSYLTIYPQVALKENVRFLDLYNLMLAESKWQEFLADGLHFSKYDPVRIFKPVLALPNLPQNRKPILIQGISQVHQRYDA